ncbi:hypothetical protein [Clostridium weizhouense]|uniref:Uncharacterized protein n=1 Tax=Clostridium weizhouense TaxID=2859781 RepID=A0ABS7APP8_9CLOT|nr:hypothetical protein [Clostridium weizhouense]MBW6410592.1 hypothetical protein [Clostridium weizhouense]
MKNIIKKIIPICIIGVVCLIGFPALKGDKDIPLAEMEGIKIEVGKTTVKEVLDKGFTIKDSEIYEPVKSIPGNKYTLSIASFEKDGKEYGSFSVANTSAVEKNIEDCLITSITYYYTHDSYYQDASVKGIVPKDLTLEQLKEKLGTPDDEYDDEIVYRSESKKYTSRFGFDKDGKLTKSKVEVDEHSL